MISFTNLSLVLLAYMMGSIPSAVWIGKLLYGVDVRDYGSGNAGATNTFRVLGKRAGLPVLILDILKGFVAVKLVWLTAKYLPDTQQFVNLELSLGLAALIGHIFPVFAGFRGGKGVATLLGILCAVHIGAALICIGVFMVTILLTHYVSLSSMLSALTFPISIMFIYHETIPGLNIFAMFVCVLVLITHQKNIERLLSGDEGKIAFQAGSKSS
ncbi:MAG: glycerol-3-phosphate 1-O-acyltransferase PlsY [Bacteroidia bacterium]|jgi:glycerol-3-phosphate acyltransferase PlsY|nr:glycerol-3-phosphate 1-O-acyltransferase PlsY [Bacteroidia bacterium]MBP7245371.1 glycerol-3-phosphate 1-O-acyltransferase PlsY [Bacteroidia bacterium]